MDLSESLSSAFEYSRAFFSRWLDWLILIVLTIIPIVDFIVIGYYAKVLRDDGSSKAPPKIEGYPEMFWDGLKAVLVALIYGIPVLIIWVAIGFSSLIPVAIVFIIIFIVELMAIVHMFKTRSFGNAFDLGEIFNVIGKIGWLQYLGFLIIYIILFAIVGAIVDLFAILSIIGIIIGLALSVLVTTFLYRSIGLLYDNAMGNGRAAVPGISPVPPETPAPTP